MAEVDPFIQPIPKQFQNDRELRAWTEYLHRFLHDIWIRTGGGDDEIENIQEEESSAEGEVSRIQALVDRLTKRVTDLEKLNDYAQINARITATNKRIDEVIEALLNKLDELKEDPVVAAKTLDALQETVRQLKLANIRLEIVSDSSLPTEEPN